MVSGLVTSPCDQLRITSGDARRMRIELNAARRRCSRSSVRLKPNRAAVTPIAVCSSVSCIIRYLLPKRPVPWTCRVGSVASSDFLELHFQTQTLKFLHQHVEGLGHAGLGRVLALHDRLVDAAPPGDVVALHG